MPEEERSVYGAKTTPDGGRMQMKAPIQEDARREETARTAEALAEGSLAEGVTGGTAVVLSILGLAGVLPFWMATIATIAIGIALLFEGGVLVSKMQNLLGLTGRTRGNEAVLGGGASAHLLGGGAGVVLGVLAILGVLPDILLPASAIVFGGTLILGAAAVARLNALFAQSRDVPSVMIGESIMAASSLQTLVGVGVVTLGILALIGIEPGLMVLISMLAVGSALLVSGTAVSSRMMALFVPR